MLRPILILLLLLAAALAVYEFGGLSGAGRLNALELPTPTMKAPDFPSNLQWLNSDRALTLAELRGKVVLLDFWTYCCINCMHIIPDLKRLEAEFPDELVVIGVHSAKFTQEGETANIRQAILRYEIEHPVINDRNFLVWQSYGARAWPTVALIDPEGRIVMIRSGEGVYGQFAEPIRQLVELYDGKNAINQKPLNLKRETETAPESCLAYPGKVIAGIVDGERLLFISDQNHNRIVVWSLDRGQVVRTIGSGSSGFRDGSFDESAFDHPQGMALVGRKLYVADTENHAVREANLETGEVTTLAGNGSQAPGWGAAAGKGRDVSLSSPWDLAAAGDSLLYVAMAGTHQIWTIRLADGFAAPFAGSSREGLQDGARQRASLAQPSGLAILGDRLYFADSEVSAIRYVEIGTPEGRVGTVVGLDLFEFGDRDGVGDDVRLQHPLGVTTDGNLLYIADTYNSKIKRIDPASRRTETLVGGKAGYRDGAKGEAQFYEPGGIHWFAGKLYIADTNNGRIRVVDPADGKVETLPVEENPPDSAAAVKAPLARVGMGAGKIFIRIVPPVGWHLNVEAPLRLSLIDGGGIARPAVAAEINLTPKEGESEFALPVIWLKGKGEAVIEVNYILCGDQDASLCIPETKQFVIPVEAGEARETGIYLKI